MKTPNACQFSNLPFPAVLVEIHHGGVGACLVLSTRPRIPPPKPLRASPPCVDEAATRRFL